MSAEPPVRCSGNGLRLRGDSGRRGRLQAVYRWYSRADRRGLGAIGLVAMYALFLLLTSVCLASGDHHAEAHQQHHGDATGHTPSLLDPCDLALRALTTSTTQTSPLLSIVLLPGPTQTPPVTPLVSAAPPILSAIRAPPSSLS